MDIFKIEISRVRFFFANADKGGKGVWKILTLADKWGRGGLTNDESTDKKTVQITFFKLILNNSNLCIFLYFPFIFWSFRYKG